VLFCSVACSRGGLRQLGRPSNGVHLDERHTLSISSSLEMLDANK
jgi:hypothetical protein